mmetsp:Transcript_45111/g.79386  ORF Transcript_45111/g.79386 Transcript_45111/m.79386 type:complete len:328 (-) Transcript_45111:26-1009(-)
MWFAILLFCCPVQVTSIPLTNKFLHGKPDDSDSAHETRVASSGLMRRVPWGQSILAPEKTADALARSGPTLLSSRCTRQTETELNCTHEFPNVPVHCCFSPTAMHHRPSRGRVYFLFTTVPPHAHRVSAVLAMMKKQSLIPDGVVLTIPKTYKRFQTEFPMAAAPISEYLTVNKIEYDYGPLSKYFGHTVLRDEDIAIVSDDDVEFSDTFIEDFVNAVESSSASNIFTGYVDREFNGVMGYSGVACRAGLLRALPKSSPDSCFLADDVVLTHYADNEHMQKVYLQKRNPNRVSSVTDDVTSIHEYHKAHKQHGANVNDGCIQDLLRR